MKALPAAALGLWPIAVFATVLEVTEGRIWPAFAIYHLGCLCIPRITPRQAGLALAGWRSWLPATLLAAIVLALANLAFVRWLGDSGMVQPEGLRALERTRPWPLFGAYMLAFNPLLEEYYWRGFLLPRAGTLAGAAMFGILHWPLYALFLGTVVGLLTCVCPFLLGILWSWTVRRKESLWPAVLTHLAVNGAMFAAASVAA